MNVIYWASHTGVNKGLALDLKQHGYNVSIILPQGTKIVREYRENGINVIEIPGKTEEMLNARLR